MHRSATPELLGAHVSIQGGVDTAPERGVAMGATAIQVFTKTPNQWREPTLGREARTAFRLAMANSGLRGVISHDSYPINPASPDPALSARSVAAFTAERGRCRDLEIRQVVSHPGNYIDDRDLGLRRNALGYARCLRAVSDPVKGLAAHARPPVHRRDQDPGDPQGRPSRGDGSQDAAPT
jgi:deoxyribonuclease-4